MITHIRDSLGLEQTCNLEVSFLEIKRYYTNPEMNVLIHFSNKGFEIARFIKKEVFREFTKENQELINIMLKHEHSVGKPDLVIEVGGQLCFIEVKSENDAYNYEQALWAKTHPNFLIIVLYVYYKPVFAWYDFNNPQPAPLP